MSLLKDRLATIDAEVESANLSFNPSNGLFEVLEGHEADNNLSYELKDALEMLPEVTEEELRDYVQWKRQWTDPKR